MQIATQAEIKRERELLAGLGLSPIKHWAARCKWYKPDGSFHAELPSDMYSRLLYMGRGLRPDAGLPVTKSSHTTLVDAVVELMRSRSAWEGTASQLLEVLDGMADELPVDATRLSKALNRLASQLVVRGVTVETLPRGRQRGLRLSG